MLSAKRVLSTSTLLDKLSRTVSLEKNGRKQKLRRPFCQFALPERKTREPFMRLRDQTPFLFLDEQSREFLFNCFRKAMVTFNSKIPITNSVLVMRPLSLKPLAPNPMKIAPV
jgi:hypothetical protein